MTDHTRARELQRIYAMRRKARRFAVQGIYEWQLSGNLPHEIEARTRADNAMHKVDLNYYHELLSRVIADHAALDQLMIHILDRDTKQLDPIELAILRLSTYEMRDHLEIPYRVVIDEAIELAKHFGGTDSHKYINGVLDKMASQLRADEKAVNKT